jgi:hypothetical protein
MRILEEGRVVGCSMNIDIQLSLFRQSAKYTAERHILRRVM